MNPSLPSRILGQTFAIGCAVTGQGGDDRAAPYTLQCVRGRGLKQRPAHLRAQGCCPHSASNGLSDAIHRIAEGGNVPKVIS